MPLSPALLALLCAFVVTTPTRPAEGIASRSRLGLRVLGGMLPSAERFDGSVLGVSAVVDLDRAQRKAHIVLTGWPFGGRIEGDAWFDHSDDERDYGGVRLDETLQTALSRRFVSISSAGHDAATDTVYVDLVVPVFGPRSMRLHRAVRASLPT